MNNPWDPKLSLTEEEALALSRILFPNFNWASLKKFGSGWDNTLFLTPDQRILRFAHRDLAGDLARQEFKTLTWLRVQGFLFAPQPLAFADEPELFPFPVMLIDFSEGTENDNETYSEEQVLQIVNCLIKLHALPPPPHARNDELGRADHTTRSPQMLSRADRLLPVLGESFCTLIKNAITRTSWSADNYDLVTVHGDLHFRHILFRRNQLHRLIDWGDSHLNSRGCDYIFYWSELNALERAQYAPYFSHLNHDEKSVAFFLSLLVGLALLEYGIATQQTRIEAKARRCLAHTMDGYF